MASFLRRFTTSASAGKNMYFILAAASAFPVYTIFNDSNTSSSSASLSSRSNVFVSTKKENLVALAPNIYALLSLTLPSIQNLLVVLFFNFSMTRFQKQHAISASLLLASMDLDMRGVIFIESSQGCVGI
jgi:hypothetical protein